MSKIEKIGNNNNCAIINEKLRYASKWLRGKLSQRNSFYGPPVSFFQASKIKSRFDLVIFIFLTVI